jgi:hypothetical protein
MGQLYTTEEVAQFLRVSQRGVQVWIRDGSLAAVRICSCWATGQVAVSRKLSANIS